MTMTQTSADSQESHKDLKRIRYDGDTYISISDMLYLCEVSRDRHNIYGHTHAADAMENFAGALDLMLKLK